MVFLRETLPGRGIAVRVIVDDVADTYRVEYTPLPDGVMTDEWAVFDGSVGYDASIFSTAAAAYAFVECVRTTSHDDILAERAVDTGGATKQEGDALDVAFAPLKGAEAQ